MTSTPRSRLLVVATVVAAAASAAVPSLALAQQGGAAAAPKPFFDSRDADRRAVERSGRESLRAPSAATRAARRAIPPGVVLDVDPLTGTPQALTGRGVALSVPNAGDRRDAADAFLAHRLALFGLTRVDL